MANTSRIRKISTRNGGPLAKAIPRERQTLHEFILPVIREELAQRDMWLAGGSSNLTRAAVAELRAELLVEVLERANCGSIGGFDKGQPPTNSVSVRAQWLFDKAQTQFGIVVED